MRRIFPIIVCAAVFSLVSCSPKITSNIIRNYEPQGSVEDVIVFKENETLPADAEWIGSIQANGNGNYEKLADLTRFKAWESGGKYVKIKDYSAQGVRSDVHVMNSDVYRADTAKVNPERIVRIDNIVNNTSSGNSGSSNYVPSQAVSTDGLQVEPTARELLGPNSFRVFAGYGRRLNRVDPSLNLFQKEHVKRLMNGVMLGGEYVYFFNVAKGGGFGVRYQIMHSSSSDPVSVTYDDGSIREGVLDEKVNISFLGPLYCGRWVSRNGKHILLDNVGLGLLMYRDKTTFINESQIIAGRTLGWTFDINYSYYLTDKLSLGADISYTSGMIRRVTVSDGNRSESYDLDKDHYEGLVHMGVCAQLVYTF